MDFKYYQGMDKVISEQDNGERLSMKEYELVYDMPSFDIAELRKVTEPDESMDLLMEKNTQLPEGLPNRIYELASRLTRNETNWYDKAKAIEDYFDGPEFIYSKDDIPYPESNQDYVDQFLFETQIGYCDNFSTCNGRFTKCRQYSCKVGKGLYGRGKINPMMVNPFIR